MAATDSFSNFEPSLISPIEGGEAVTTSDSVELTKVSRRIYIGVAGHLKVVTKDGTTLTFSNAPVGWHEIRAKQILATGTTATNIVACY